MKLRGLVRADAPRAAVLIRFAVGVVFASEGIQKFLQPEAQAAGRFAKIGIPAPEIMGPFVGVVETVCGGLVLLGLATRFAAVPLVVDMLVALASTKLPILLGRGYWIFAHTFAPKAGLWAFLHESRTDLSMLCGATFLAIVGSDAWALDARMMKRRADHVQEAP
jgi:putative oxidoreductase